jgi:hypothetical protein
MFGLVEMHTGIYRSASMPDAADLRQRADLYRRIANVPAASAHRADSVLLVRADELEHRAKEVEGRDLKRACATSTRQSQIDCPYRHRCSSLTIPLK